MLLAPLLLLAQVAAASVQGSWSQGRPPECAGSTAAAGGARAANVWERAKSPELRRYCDRLASAASKLAGTAAMAAQALQAAREADGILPGHAAPRVLEGRALEALGKLDDALAALKDARSRDARALDEPIALLAWARVLARTGHAKEAADAYRALLPRTSSLSGAERSAAAIEAGLAAMTRGAAGLDEAAAALRAGMSEAQDEAQPVAVLALALALDRRGEAGESRALLAERAPPGSGNPATVLDDDRARELLAVSPAEADAMTALALESFDPQSAREAWQAYLAASPQGPWTAHAKAHLAALESRRRGR